MPARRAEPKERKSQGRTADDQTSPPPVAAARGRCARAAGLAAQRPRTKLSGPAGAPRGRLCGRQDRKSTRLNSSHVEISYAVFCLKKKKKNKAHLKKKKKNKRKKKR